MGARFYGCKNKDCTLCENNPHKRCSEIDNFDECYADNQTLRSKVGNRKSAWEACSQDMGSKV